jgi:hypothetical protein
LESLLPQKARNEQNHAHASESSHNMPIWIDDGTGMLQTLGLTLKESYEKQFRNDPPRLCPLLRKARRKLKLLREARKQDSQEASMAGVHGNKMSYSDHNAHEKGV